MSRWLEEREKSVEARQALVTLTATQLFKCKAGACAAQLEHNKFAGVRAEVQDALALDRQAAIDRAARLKRKCAFTCLHAKAPYVPVHRSLICAVQGTHCACVVPLIPHPGAYASVVPFSPEAVLGCDACVGPCCLWMWC